MKQNKMDLEESHKVLTEHSNMRIQRRHLDFSYTLNFC